MERNIHITPYKPIELGMPSGMIWADRDYDAPNKAQEGTKISLKSAQAMKLGSWCMPTIENFKDLLHECQWRYSDNQTIVTGPNGNSIRFGAYGDYWVNDDKTHDVKMLNIDWDEFESSHEKYCRVLVDTFYETTPDDYHYLRAVVASRDKADISEVSLDAFETLKICAYVDGDDEAEIEWESSDNSIAYVYDGGIVAENIGECLLTAKCERYGLRAQIKVTVQGHKL